MGRWWRRFGFVRDCGGGRVERDCEGELIVRRGGRWWSRRRWLLCCFNLLFHIVLSLLLVLMCFHNGVSEIVLKTNKIRCSNMCYCLYDLLRIGSGLFLPFTYIIQSNAMRWDKMISFTRVLRRTLLLNLFVGSLSSPNSNGCAGFWKWAHKHPKLAT